MNDWTDVSILLSKSIRIWMVTGTEQILFTFLSQFECILYMHSYINSYMYFADRILGGHANGSISFQLAQIRIGADKVPISIVLYIDATFIKRGIPIRPIYYKYICIHIWINIWIVLSIHTWINVWIMQCIQIWINLWNLQWDVSTTTAPLCLVLTHGDRLDCYPSWSQERLPTTTRNGKGIGVLSCTTAVWTLS